MKGTYKGSKCCKQEGLNGTDPPLDDGYSLGAETLPKPNDETMGFMRN